MPDYEMMPQDPLAPLPEGQPLPEDAGDALQGTAGGDAPAPEIAAQDAPPPPPRPPRDDAGDEDGGPNGRPEGPPDLSAPDMPPPGPPPLPTVSAREIDGSGNNAENDLWGATGTNQIRLVDNGYADGLGEMVDGLPSAREVSNAVFAQDEDMPSSFGLSAMFYAWGQFIDHDIDLTFSGGDDAPIDVPLGDPWFDPFGTGEETIAFTRTPDADDSTALREQVNSITTWLDGSMLYGSDAETHATVLDEETGKLVLDEDGNLELTETGGVVAGDVRAAENLGLVSMQTLFAREHNRIVDKLSEDFPEMTAEELFGAARAQVEAVIQAVTYNEFLPVLLGEDAIEAYAGYDSSVDASVSVEFSTVAFRFGHTLIGSAVNRLTENGETSEFGDLTLAESFFQPQRIAEEGGIADVLRGLADGFSQELDAIVVDDLRNFLFGPPGSGGLDLASLNIQRGRDHGIPGYNELRAGLGLEVAESFADITDDEEMQAALEEVYGDVDSVDAWVGGLAEEPAGDTIVGELFAVILVDQFTRLRDGDAQWSQNVMSEHEATRLWHTTLSDVIERNSDVGEIQKNIMYAYDRQGGGDGDDRLEGTDARDLLLGEDGNDRLEGRAGEDELHGGRGHDRLSGGDDDDLLYGDSGNDRLSGGAGDDGLHGGRGNDKLRGDDGDDGLFGDEGRDKLAGGAGNDRLDGGDDRDKLCGNDGDDRLNGGADHDKLMGGDGADWLNGGAGKDMLCGGDGADIYVFGPRSGRDKIKEGGSDDATDSIHIAGVDSFDDLDFSINRDHLVIEWGEGDCVKIAGQFADRGGSVEELQLDDGSTLSLTLDALEDWLV